MKKLILVSFLLISSKLLAFKQIEVITIKKYPSYVEVTVTMRFQVPAALMSAGVPVSNASSIVSTYGNYSVDTISVTPFYVVTKTETISFVPTTLAAFKSALISKYNSINTQVQNLSLTVYDSIVRAYWDGSNWVAQ